MNTVLLIANSLALVGASLVVVFSGRVLTKVAVAGADCLKNSAVALENIVNSESIQRKHETRELGIITTTLANSVKEIHSLSKEWNEERWAVTNSRIEMLEMRLAVRPLNEQRKPE